MGGIPWWAALIGTPIVAGKMASGVAETVDSLNKVNEAWDTRKDKEQFAKDYKSFRDSKTYLPTPGSYRNPETELKAVQMFQKEAAPTLMDQFKTSYENATGTSDPRFFGTAAGREELAKVGVKPPVNNPVFNTALADFQKEGAQRITLKSAAEGDTLALADLAADKDLSQSWENTQKGIASQATRERETREAKDKLDAAAQQADFERIAAGIGGRYQDAQPKQFNEGADGALQQVPITAPEGKQPNVWNGGFNYVDGKGNVTPRRIMPYEEARAMLLQASADYPKADTKEALKGLEKQYNESYSNADYVPSAQNWMGTATNDKNQLQLAAESGDPLAKRIIAAQDTREIALNKAKAEDRRIAIVQNPTTKLEMNALTPEEQTALNVAVAERRLDPYKINSKNQKMLAGIAIAKPGVDLNTISAEMGLARNTNIQIKAATAEMLPGLVQKTVEAGKALNYSDAKFAGVAEKWKNGQINDPRLTKYMTLRNDQLLTIGGVMRANGMTDMAQKLEEEAMHPTLSPRALDAWMEGQLESIDPRLNFYRAATKGNKVIPRANYTPKAATGYGASIPTAGGIVDLRAAAAAELARRQGRK